MIVVLQSGQTGVERGAHRGALAAGLFIAGFMPLDRRDELGQIPQDVARYLTPCFDRGPRPSVRANVALASAALIVVPDANQPEKFTAMLALLQAVRAARLPSLVCDERSNLDTVVQWTRTVPETSGSTRILVTGPRETRWERGEAVARRIVSAIAMATGYDDDVLRLRR